MVDTGYKTPTDASNDGSGTTWNPWAGQGTLAEGLQVQSDGKAPYVTGDNFTSKGLMAYDFDFSIPTDATVTGIEAFIRVKHGSTTITGKLITVKLRNSGGALGDDQTGTDATLTSSYQNLTYGGSSNLWGLTTATINPTLINSSAFGVYVVVKNESTTSPDGNIFVDQIQLKVYYTEAEGDESEAITPVYSTAIIPVQTEKTTYNASEPIKIVVLDREENIIGFLDLKDVRVKLTDSFEESTLELEKPLNNEG